MDKIEPQQIHQHGCHGICLFPQDKVGMLFSVFSCFMSLTKASSSTNSRTRNCDSENRRVEIYIKNKIKK